LTAEERAEAELMRALAEPEWRATVLKNIEADDLITPLARRFLEFVIEYREQLGSDEAELIRLINLQNIPDFSDAIRERLQEFRARMANEPITEALIGQCATTLQRHRKLTQIIEERDRLLLQPSISLADKERVNELHRLYRELKGSAGSR
jgi:hypothetical protein